MVLPYIVYILLLPWVMHVAQRIFYCVYFWQVKEYRFDRIKGDHIKSLKVFFPKTSILAMFIIILLPLYSGPENIYLWDNLVFVIFSLLGVYSFILFIKNKWRLPKFTKKALLLLSLSFIVLAFSVIVFAGKFFLFVAISEILISFVTFALSQILQIPTFFIKNSIYRKAKKKISDQKDLFVIGITGSYGKSSTKEFLYAILSKKYKVLKTSGNINTEIGVAQTVIKDLMPDHEVFIVEMGAYRRGEIKLMCDIVKPKIGVVTGVNEQHMALFGSLENLLSAEGGGELAGSLPKDGTLIVNGDNKYCASLYKRTNKNKKIYSIKNDRINPDIWTDSATVNERSISFLTIDKDKKMLHFDVNVLGAQNIQNILAAILVAKEMEMSTEDIVEATKEIKQDQAGMALNKNKHGINVVDSSYSSNPDGVIADLNYLNIFKQKKVIVMPCVIELGKKSAEIHQKIGKKIAEVCDMAVITTKDNFEDVRTGAIEAGMDYDKIVLCDNPEQIHSMITVFCKAEDTILLEGRVPRRLIEMFRE